MSTRWICCVECFTGERLAFPENLVVITFDTRRAKILATCEEERMKTHERRIRSQLGAQASARAEFGEPSDTAKAYIESEVERVLGKTRARVKRIKAAEAMVHHNNNRLYVRAVTHVDTWDQMMEYTRSGVLEPASKELEGFAKQDAGWSENQGGNAKDADVDVEHETGHEGQEPE